MNLISKKQTERCDAIVAGRVVGLGRTELSQCQIRTHLGFDCTDDYAYGRPCDHSYGGPYGSPHSLVLRADDRTVVCTDVRTWSSQYDALEISQA